MKKLLLGTVALAALGAGVTANAAEIAVPRRAAYVAPVAYTNWTGCHLGGMVGDEVGRNDGWTTRATTVGAVGGINEPTAALAAGVGAGVPIAPRYNLDGFIGGVYGGCDYQAGAWVIGIETDWANVNKSGQAFDLPPFNTNFVKETQERWVSTLRGRLGWAVDKWLLYVTGGAAWMRIDSSSWNILAPITTGLTQTDTRTGWTVGAGIEYAVGWGWSARTQYLFVEIPSFTTLTPGTGNGFINGTTLTNLDNGRIFNHFFEFGLTYKFGNYASAAPVTK
jgi:outer membrane immunogenic protein